MILLHVLILITLQTGTRVSSSVAARYHGQEADLALGKQKMREILKGEGSVIFYNREEVVGLADGTG